jgi:hypothetical protein
MQCPEPMRHWEPVGYFEFIDSQEQTTITLDIHRSCNFILLKPTNLRKTPYDNSEHFNKNPIEIKLF